jgi:carbon storage regulator
MLVLTRKVNQTLIIGNGSLAAQITILGIRGNYVRIGIEAPAEVRIVRLEIADPQDADAIPETR